MLVTFNVDGDIGLKPHKIDALQESLVCRVTEFALRLDVSAHS